MCWPSSRYRRVSFIVRLKRIGWRDGHAPPAPELPLVHNGRSANRVYPAEGQLPAAQWQRLKQRIAQAKLTPSGVLAAAFAEVLAQWSKQAQFTLNLTLFNRLPLHPAVNTIVGDLPR